MGVCSLGRETRNKEKGHDGGEERLGSSKTQHAYRFGRGRSERSPAREIPGSFVYCRGLENTEKYPEKNPSESYNQTTLDSLLKA